MEKCSHMTDMISSCSQLQWKCNINIEQFPSAAAVLQDRKEQLLPACVWLDMKATAPIAKVKTHTHTHTHTCINILYKYQMWSLSLSLSLSQRWICATGITVDAHSMLYVQRSQQEWGPVPVERATLEMGSSAWVCVVTSDPLVLTHN